MFFKFLKHPLTAFIAIIAGILFGYYMGDTALRLDDISKIYSLLLQVTIVPILVSAIISSVGHFIQNHNFPHIASVAWKAVVIAILITVILALYLSFILKPGALSLEGSASLSRYIGSQTDVLVANLDEQVNYTEKESGFVIFVRALIPSNLFEALAEGKALSLAFVSVIIGIAAGLYQVRRRKSGQLGTADNILIVLCDNIFSIFQQIISAILVFLPVALVLIIANLVAAEGLRLFAVMSRLIATFYAVGLLLVLLGSLALAFFTKRSFFYVLKVSLAPGFLGFMTKSSVATIPSCIEHLTTKLDMDEDLAKLLVPLFLVLWRFGNLAYFAVVTIFSAQIYQVDISVFGFIALVVSLIFASVATAGATGFATLNVISIAFLPLGIPVETMLVVLYAIDPIIDPIRTMIIVHTNFVIIGIVGNKKIESSSSDNFKKDTQILDRANASGLQPKTPAVSHRE